MISSLSIPSAYLETTSEDLRKNIMEENFKARNAAKKSLQHVRACGEMLIELKARAGHGNFRYELGLLRIKTSTAANYMKVAANIQHVGHLGSGMRDALKLLSKGDAQLEESEESQLPPPAPRPSPAPRPAPSSVTIEAEIVEPAPEIKSVSPDEIDDVEPFVVDGTKTAPASTDCWSMARNFIATLKLLTAWQERSALCDVRQAINNRLVELDKLNGKEKPNITNP